MPSQKFDVFQGRREQEGESGDRRDLHHDRADEEVEERADKKVVVVEG